MGRARKGLAVTLTMMAVVLAPSLACADGPQLRFSANVLALDVVGGGTSDYAMIGGGASIGLDVSSIDILDLGVRGRFVVAPFFTSDRVWGAPGWAGTFALAARLHTPLVVGGVSWSLGIEAGGSGGQLAFRGDAREMLGAFSLIIQPGLEHVITPRFAMTYAIDLGVLAGPWLLLQGAVVVGIRAG